MMDWLLRGRIKTALTMTNIADEPDDSQTNKTQIAKGEMDQAVSMKSGIRDNRPSRGTVASFLKDKIHPGGDLSIVSAYFIMAQYGFRGAR